MTSFLQVNEENFEREILHSSVPVLLEFGAAWCAPCKRMEPELLKLAETLTGKIRMAKLDVDESVQLTMQYQVMSVPTLILFVQGEALQRLSGYQPRDRVAEKIEPYI